MTVAMSRTCDITGVKVLQKYCCEPNFELFGKVSQLTLLD